MESSGIGRNGLREERHLCVVGDRLERDSWIRESVERDSWIRESGGR